MCILVYRLARLEYIQTSVIGFLNISKMSGFFRRKIYLFCIYKNFGSAVIEA